MGEIIFKEVNKQKWTYLDPDFKVWILIGNRYQFYDKENEQLTIGKIEEDNQKWIWQLLFSNEISEYVKCDESNGKIYIRNESESIDLEIFLNRAFLPQKVVQKDPSGLELVYYFKGYKKKIKIEKKDFDLEIPENVDIIDTQ